MIIRTSTKNTIATDRPLTANEAAALTAQIRKTVDRVWELLLEAQEREAWKALRYPTWEAYVNAEFAMSRRNSYRLLDLARVIREIEDFVPHAAQITQRDVEAIKHDLPAVKAEISARVEQGAEPGEAATDVIAEARAAKAKARDERKSEQAENDRQREEHRAALPDAIKQREQDRADAIAKRKGEPSDNLALHDRVAELEEANRVLEAENASFRAEVAKFGDMRVQFEQGGFEKILADKDEVIRVLEARVVSESADAASWRKSARYWQDEARKLGWSDTVVIDIETGETVNG